MPSGAGMVYVAIRGLPFVVGVTLTNVACPLKLGPLTLMSSLSNVETSTAVLSV
jgi:hypothetical protein